MGTGTCNSCYDASSARQAKPSMSLGVKATIAAQLIFYMAPALLQPSLYLQIQASYANPNRVFALVLTTSSVLSMCLPVPLGIWADMSGERIVYCSIQLVAAMAAAMFALSMSAPVFAIAWALLNAPPALRGVRAAYFAKHVAPEELSRTGQLASSAGLAGGFLGPLASALLELVIGDRSFVVAAWLALGLSMASFIALLISIPPDLHSRGEAGRGASFRETVERCERCSEKMSEEEQKYSTALCNGCWDSFSGENYSFRRFSQHVLISFCPIGALLEASMNAGVIATFQPIAVTHFSWGNKLIAAVNFAGAGLSVLVSLLMAHLRLPEKAQTAAAAALYLLGVIVFTMPPLSEWKLVLGFMLGIKAQILFMAPFTAVFSRLIGQARVTNRLTMALCLAPSIGAALGTTFAPSFEAVAGKAFFMLVSLPALYACIAIAVGWWLLEKYSPEKKKAKRKGLWPQEAEEMIEVDDRKVAKIDPIVINSDGEKRDGNEDSDPETTDPSPVISVQPESDSDEDDGSARSASKATPRGLAIGRPHDLEEGEGREEVTAMTSSFPTNSSVFPSFSAGF